MLLSGPTGNSVTSSVVQLDTNVAVAAGSSTPAANNFATSGVTAGTYTILVWSHDGASSAPAATDPSTLVSVTALI